MKIGIVSDSHGHAARLRRALAALVGRGAEVIVHCGDLGTGECLAALAETHLPAYAVAGNADLDSRQLQQEARVHGVHFQLDKLLVPLGNQQHLAVTHGSAARVLAELISAGRFPYVCHGHTHARRDERVGPTRVINPGALHHASPSTAALLDTDSQTVDYIEVP